MDSVDVVRWTTFLWSLTCRIFFLLQNFAVGDLWFLTGLLMLFPSDLTLFLRLQLLQTATFLSQLRLLLLLCFQDSFFKLQKKTLALLQAGTLESHVTCRESSHLTFHLAYVVKDFHTADLSEAIWSQARSLKELLQSHGIKKIYTGGRGREGMRGDKVGVWWR